MYYLVLKTYLSKAKPCVWKDLWNIISTINIFNYFIHYHFSYECRESSTYVTRQLKHVGSRSSQGFLCIHIHSVSSLFQKSWLLLASVNILSLHTCGSRENAMIVSNISGLTKTNFFFTEWEYWKETIHWNMFIVILFPTENKFLRGQRWGLFYDTYIA